MRKFFGLVASLFAAMMILGGCAMTPAEEASSVKSPLKPATDGNDKNCNDNNACTTDSVDPASKMCLYTPVVCNDNSVCTTDSCNSATGCVFTPVVGCCLLDTDCNAGQVCDLIQNVCIGCLVDVDCDDGDACTTDTCDSNVCGYASVVCDDGFFCNGTETCNPATGCVDGDAPELDDGVDCTVDACDEVADEVTHSGDDSVCDDANVCNGDEICSVDVGCEAGTAMDCDDGDACTTDSCDPTVGCEYVGVVCDDGDVCTADSCVPATGCVFTDVLGCCEAGIDCDDGNPCTIEWCDLPTNQCQYDTGVPCDDGNPCTTDSCDPGGCSNTPIVCDDNNVCNGSETCNPATGCVAGAPLTCNDLNPCTTDTCDTVTGCVFTGIAGCCTTDLQCFGIGETSWGYSSPCAVDADCVEPGHVCVEGTMCLPAAYDFGCSAYDDVLGNPNNEPGTCEMCADTDQDGWCSSVETFCDGGLDENGDGLVDCEDADCDDEVCGVNMVCTNGVCVQQACVPQCVGLECGDDGCGGFCGECAGWEECQTGACVNMSPWCSDPTVTVEGPCTGESDLALVLGLDPSSPTIISDILAILPQLTTGCHDAVAEVTQELTIGCGAICLAGFSLDCEECLDPYWTESIASLTGSIACMPVPAECMLDTDCDVGEICTAGVCESAPTEPCGTTNCFAGFHCEGNLCVSDGRKVWCWDDTLPGESGVAHCHTFTGPAGTYWSPPVWAFADYSAIPPKCGSAPTGITPPPVQYPAPVCCVSGAGALGSCDGGATFRPYQ